MPGALCHLPEPFSCPHLAPGSSDPPELLLSGSGEVCHILGGTHRRDLLGHLPEDVKFRSCILTHPACPSPKSPWIPLQSCSPPLVLCVAAVGGNSKYPKAEEALGKACSGHGLLQDEVGSAFKSFIRNQHSQAMGSFQESFWAPGTTVLLGQVLALSLWALNKALQSATISAPVCRIHGFFFLPALCRKSVFFFWQKGLFCTFFLCPGGF